VVPGKQIKFRRFVPNQISFNAFPTVYRVTRTGRQCAPRVRSNPLLLFIKSPPPPSDKYQCNAGKPISDEKRPHRAVSRHIQSNSEAKHSPTALELKNANQHVSSFLITFFRRPFKQCFSTGGPQVVTKWPASVAYSKPLFFMLHCCQIVSTVHHFFFYFHAGVKHTIPSTYSLISLYFI
jgi:hypothetical protein